MQYLSHNHLNSSYFVWQGRICSWETKSSEFRSLVRFAFVEGNGSLTTIITLPALATLLCARAPQ